MLFMLNNTSQQLLDAAYTLPDLEDLRASGVRDGGDGGNGSSNGENTSSNNEIISKGKDAIKNFTDIWNKNKNKLGLFIVYDYIHNIQAAVDQLTDFYTGEYYTDYCTQRKMLITAIKRMPGSRGILFRQHNITKPRCLPLIYRYFTIQHGMQII